jgi:hypothetical protein
LSEHPRMSGAAYGLAAFAILASGSVSSCHCVDSTGAKDQGASSSHEPSARVATSAADVSRPPTPSTRMLPSNAASAPGPSSGTFPFAGAVIRVADMDATDEYQLDVQRARGDAVEILERDARGALPDRATLVFPWHVFDDAHGIVTFSQMNVVTHEGRPNGSASEDPQRFELQDSTPPFVLSRAAANAAETTGRLAGIRVWDYLGAFPPLERHGTETATIKVRGVSRVLEAERFTAQWPDVGKLLLVRKLEPFGDVNLVLRVGRDDLFVMDLLSID